MVIHRLIKQFIRAKQMREGGGFVVRRPIGGNDLHQVDPFLLLDHLGPVCYGPGEAVGAPDHPHRGFETVTYVISGGFHHQDSKGNEGNLNAGWVQWMTAGGGVVHSEMPTEQLLRDGGEMEGFQLWVNLPAKLKMIDPRYQDTPPDRIPKVTSGDEQTTVSIIAGDCLGQSANIETHTPIMYLDICVKAGGSFEVDVPESHDTAFCYVWRGEGYLAEEKREVREGDGVHLHSEGTSFRISGGATSSIKVLFISGASIGEPIQRHGPFVMNTQAEIKQAFADYQSGKLAPQIKGAQERRAKTDAAVAKSKQTGAWDKHI